MTLKFLYILLLSFLLAFLYYIFSPLRFTPYGYNLTLGQIAERDIIAPFEFNIEKDEKTLISEQELAALNVRPVYKISQTLNFSTMKNLDFIIKPFVENPDRNFVTIKKVLDDSGFKISEQSVIYLLNDEFRNKLYEILTKQLKEIFRVGIYQGNYPYQKIKIVNEKGINEYYLHQLYSMEEVKNKILKSATDPIQKKVLSEIANGILIVDITQDTEATNLEQQKARDKISKYKGKVLKNEKIVSKSQKVTSDIMAKLNSLKKVQSNPEFASTNNEILISSSGVFLFSFIVLLIFFQIITFIPTAKIDSHRHYLLLSSLLLLQVLMTVVLSSIFKISPFSIPYAFSLIIVIMLFAPEIGFLFNILLFLFTSLFLNWAVVTPLICFLAGTAAIMVYKKAVKKELPPFFFVFSLAYYLFLIAFSLLKLDGIDVVLLNSFYGLIAIAASFASAITVLPFIHRRLNIASRQILLDLLDFENPILHKIQQEIPGTYHHSVIVGNIAESAADAIGANSLLARVGGIYHDIGKLKNPRIFIENNPNAAEQHNKLMADESARLIRDHLKNGIEFAKKEKLPQAVIDIIYQHHGTSVIRYFLNKAKETNLHIEKKNFCYQGTKPQTKEAAIVMIADIVESTSKSISNITEQELKNTIERTVDNLIKDGQLDESPITLKDLTEIKKHILPILVGVYSKRIEYPK